MKRKPQAASAGDSQPGTMDDGNDEVTAYASKEETGRAILAVLQQRHEFLQSKNIADTSHVLTSRERAEMVKLVRRKYESAEDQLRLQRRDREIRRKELAEAREGAGGAPQPANRRGKGKGCGEAHAGDAAPSTRLGSVAKYVKDQKRSRWCRHLQRVCGSKQIWEVLAFTGRFDVDLLLAAVQEPDPDAEAKAATESLKEVRRKLHHTKAEAKAAYNEGVRLSNKRNARRESSASQPARICTQNQLHVLEKHDSGQL